MSGTNSRKISELTTATGIVGNELMVIVQDGETRQAVVSLLTSTAPVWTVNGQIGDVVIDSYDISGLDQIVADGGVSAALVSINAQISVLAGGGLTDAPSDGSVYARQDGAWVIVSATAINDTLVSLVAFSGDAAATFVLHDLAITSVNAAHTSVVSAITSINAAHTSLVGAVAGLTAPYDIAFNFGTSLVAQGEYARIVTPRTFYVLPSCSLSRIDFYTSAFPSTIVSIPVMYPTSTTLGVLLIGVSGTATWPAIATVCVTAGQTFGVQTSVSANAGLLGLVVTFAGHVRL